MIIEIKIPGAGESITEVAIGSWLAEDGAIIEKDQEIAEVETDKATLPLIASESGKLKIRVTAGQRVQVGDIACTIDTTYAAQSSSLKKTIDKPVKPVIPSPISKAKAENVIGQPKVGSFAVKVTPLAQNIMNQNNLNVDEIINGLKKITRQEVELVINNRGPKPPVVHTLFAGRESERTPMSPFRRKLSKRLVAVKNETAMLTTFNELDMSSLLEIRKKYQSRFQDKHGQKLGLMSFFAKACAEALKLFPRVNSLIDGEDIITPHFIDIAIAVQTDKGLMVPVIRNSQTMNLAQLEITIADLAQKAKTTKLTIDEMTGGTFTITNGGVFGSMLSTPILNPPQSAILGMHNIVERPVVNNGNIEIRPIMYVALSYDHRLIDGRDSVSFLVKVKELIESPLKMVLEGADPEKILLDL
jgi:2-oxoglutarate dehydrogenase E2 component (dihydrolipoamide succinyltransferase)